MKQPDPYSSLGGQQSTMRFEGPGMYRPSMSVVYPMRDAIADRIPGLDAQTRVIRSSTLLQEDQDEIDRRRAAGPPMDPR